MLSHCRGVLCFTFVGSVGASNWRSAGYLDIRFSHALRYPPAGLSLLSSWFGPRRTVYLCTSSSTKWGLRNKGWDEAAKRCERWKKASLYFRQHPLCEADRVHLSVV